MRSLFCLILCSTVMAFGAYAQRGGGHGGGGGGSRGSVGGGGHSFSSGGSFGGYGYPYWGFGLGSPYYGYYGGYPYYGYGYSDPYAYPSYNPNAYYGDPPADPPAYGQGQPAYGQNQPAYGQNQPAYRGTGEYDQYGQRVSRPGATPADSAPIYLFAFKDHTIEAASGYSVTGGTLHYNTLEHVQKQAPLNELDRSLTLRLNKEHSGFNLPGE